MNTKSLSLIQKSFLQIIPMSDIAETIFYEHLLLLEPELAIGSKSSQLTVWKALARLIELVPASERMNRYAHRLGYLCADRGLYPSTYPSIAQALLWTGRHLVPNHPDEETIDAWRQLFAVVAHHMKAGAQRHPSVGIATVSHSGP